MRNLGDLRNDFDFNQTPRRPLILPTSPRLVRYLGLWHGHIVDLLQSPPITLTRLPDARTVGRLTGFLTDDPADRCLNGSALVVSTARRELPHTYIVTRPTDRRRCAGETTWTFGDQGF
jgi:hypothetical protein